MQACNDGTCCTQGTVCSGDGRCAEPVTSTTSQEDEDEDEATSTAASPGTAATKTAKATITFRYNPNKKVKSITGKRIPLSNKAILMHMCEGIKQYLGKTSQEVQLTKSTADRDARRQIMCPSGFCADAVKQYAAAYPDVDPADLVVASGMSCDEFPFASTRQGGNLGAGSRICVEGWENSWQGGTMSRKVSALAEEDDFKVVIEGWDCDKQAPTKRKFKQRDVSDDLTNDDLWDNFADTNQNALIMSLGDLTAGSYRYDLYLASGSIASLTVVDYLGDILFNNNQTYENNGSSDPRKTIDFTLSSAAAGVGLIALTDQTDIQLNYTASNASTKSGGDDVSKKSMASGSSAWNWWWTVLGLSFIQYMLL